MGYNGLIIMGTVLFILSFIFAIFAVALFVDGKFNKNKERVKESKPFAIGAAAFFIFSIILTVWYDNVHIDINEINAEAAESAQEYTVEIKEINVYHESTGRSNYLTGVTITTEADEQLSFSEDNTNNIQSLRRIAPGQQIRYEHYVGAKHPLVGNHVEAVDRYNILGVSEPEK